MKRFTLNISAAAGLAILAGVAQATGLSAPVEIRDAADSWVFEVEADRQSFDELRITRIVNDLAREHSRAKESLSLANTGLSIEKRTTLEVSAGKRDLARLPSGVYVQRIVIDALPVTTDAEPYRAKRIVYFRVDNGAVERIDMREYSEITDPRHLEPGPRGQDILVYAGAAIEETAERTPAAINTDVQLESGDRFATPARAVKPALNADAATPLPERIDN